MTKRLAVACVLPCLIAFAVVNGVLPSAAAQSQTPYSLQGLSSICVLVEDLPDGASLHGLTPKMIQSDVEQRLRLAGLHVITAEESYRMPGSPYLHVQLSLADRARAANVDVELDQGALLMRNGEVLPSVITWRRSALLAKPTVQTIRDAVKERVDTFLNAWIAANTRPNS